MTGHEKKSEPYLSTDSASILHGLDPADLTQAELDEATVFSLTDGERCSSFEIAAAIIEMSHTPRTEMPQGLAAKLRNNFKEQRLSE